MEISLLDVADVPSESHSYCDVSSGSLPEVRPLPTDPGEKILLVAEAELLVRIRKSGRLRAPAVEVVVLLAATVPSNRRWGGGGLDACRPLRGFLRAGCDEEADGYSGVGRACPAVRCAVDAGIDAVGGRKRVGAVYRDADVLGWGRVVRVVSGAVEEFPSGVAWGMGLPFVVPVSRPTPILL